MVSQDVVLFNDTVAQQRRLRPDSRSRQGDRGARAANLWDTVDAMPNGIDTLVGDNGMMLSGGQRQRLAIARAIYKDAPILILDEATSALDSESERHVQAALETLMKGRTTLVIAQRLSTIERANHLLVMEAGGHIVECGSHRELLAQERVVRTSASDSVSAECGISVRRLRRLPAASPFHGSGCPTGPRDLLEDGNAALC